MNILRKFLSVKIILAQKLRASFFFLANKIFNKDISVYRDIKIGKGVICRATDGGTLSIGKGASIGQNAIIEAKGGNILIGENVFVGAGCIIICKEHIRIGSNCQIAEYVVIRDQDHSSSSRPIKDAGFKIAPIEIGEDVWIGAKATIVKGSTIGDGSIIGAHSLVRTDIPSFSLATGIPAEVTKKIL
jgi:acetyltransferase-like isoleucine patch superfamily enzyme